MSLVQIRKPLASLVRDEIDPFYALQTDMNKLFNHFVSEPLIDNNIIKTSGWNVKIDLKESAKEFILTADLPGFEKKDISLNFEDNMLVLKGQRSAEELKNGEKYHYMERAFGSFERRFALDENLIDKSKKISAKFENGILTVSLTKKPEAQKILQKIEID